MFRSKYQSQSYEQPRNPLQKAPSERSMSDLLLEMPVEKTQRYQCEFSPCRTYRYTLVDEWDASKPRIMFIGLNPSTADEQKLDPTLNRIHKWSEGWGYGSFVMTNLFAFRSPHPKVMQACEEPIGPLNDYWLAKSAECSQRVVLAWGNGGAWMSRGDLVERMLTLLPLGPRAFSCLGQTMHGYPTHPLARGKHRVPDDVQLQVWGANGHGSTGR